MTSIGDRILIIGRNGQMSRSLDERLVAGGYHVVKIGRPEVDLRDPVSVSKAVEAAKPAFVVNAAAYTAVDQAEEEPAAAFETNAAGAQAAAKAAADIGATIIHFSTDYVFDGTKRTPYAETDAVGPIGIYAQSKLMGERLVAEANPKHVILRTAWIFSPFGSNFVKTMVRLNQERREINVVDDQYGSPTYAIDLADTVCQIVDRLRNFPPSTDCFGTFHAANDGETSWHLFARAIIDGAAHRGAPRAIIHPIATSAYPTKARRPAYSVLAADKLSRVYGVRLRPWQ
ncbi:MAG TPA: dTDP-4-dehydrorhamnose reductase, partial [Hyphomicrobium sp.]|nr:dTDP-4-dehydrorhamnose reductase [Hyphomicrobium sp.]